MTRHTQRRRIVVATVVSGALLLVGPAAYGVATAADKIDNPAASSSQNPGDDQDQDGSGDGSDGQSGNSGDGSESTKDQQGQGDQNQDGQNGGDQKQDGQGQNGSGQDGKDEKNDDPNGLGVLATDCSGSTLQPHDGFQNGNRCVSTAFGEVGTQDKNPSLLITSAPTQVSPGQGFQLTVSTRNLIRDRFLAAAKGGYYKESSLLNGQGLQRGHFHTACRVLPNADEAPDAAPKPEFFLATEDGSGSATPDKVTIDVPGVQQAGDLQCSSWAGDGSHRIPMMQRADQTPAFDSVRVKVG
ncbi:Pecanex-like protein 1 [Pseudonocardia endophytica]|uniref:Pecanex-like protein 1 n=1 Tax=Pseudonocardia endophytica TaxID=401976 RepID=A0A4R1IAA0_PSEEN|nr:Pecanex-like protein 1 [Pseudonocardia endophytica]TCK27252.1 hypothetical protein EV378_3119 [Pseudonocardia endophytica]